MSLLKTHGLYNRSRVERSRRKLFEKIWKNYTPDGDIADDSVLVPAFQKLIDYSLKMIESHKRISQGELSAD